MQWRAGCAERQWHRQEAPAAVEQVPGEQVQGYYSPTLGAPEHDTIRLLEKELLRFYATFGEAGTPVAVCLYDSATVVVMLVCLLQY